MLLIMFSNIIPFSFLQILRAIFLISGLLLKNEKITNKTCKNGRDITFKKINGDANLITCEWLCKKDPKCVEMAIVENRWCHGCAKALDQEYVPDRFGKSSVYSSLP